MPKQSWSARRSLTIASRSCRCAVSVCSSKTNDASIVIDVHIDWDAVRETIFRCGRERKVRHFLSNFSTSWILIHFFSFVPLPPTAPLNFFGRDDFVASAISDLETGVRKIPPARLAILGPGGIGKTSTALTILHHTR